MDPDCFSLEVEVSGRMADLKKCANKQFMRICQSVDCKGGTYR